MIHLPYLSSMFHRNIFRYSAMIPPMKNQASLYSLSHILLAVNKLQLQRTISFIDTDREQNINRIFSPLSLL